MIWPRTGPGPGLADRAAQWPSGPGRGPTRWPRRAYRRSGAGSLLHESRLYSFDPSGNVSAISSTLGFPASYLYDARGRLVSDSIAGRTCDPESREYDGFGNFVRILGTVSTPLPPSRSTNRLSSSLAVYDGAGRLVDQQVSQTLWLGRDYYPDGALTSFVLLDSFGRPLAGSPSTRETFTGHERNHVSGDGNLLPLSDYMHARTYVPTWGRFTRPDPIDSFFLLDPQSFNRYAYARNNPLKYVDPDGRASVGAAAVAKRALQGAAIGAGARVTINAAIRYFQPDYNIRTGVPGSAASGALTGGVSAQRTLAKVGAHVVGNTVGALVNGVKDGKKGDRLITAAANGAVSGLLTGVGDVAASAAAEKLTGSVPSATGTMEGFERSLGSAIAGTGSFVQELVSDVLAVLDLIAGEPPSDAEACARGESNCNQAPTSPIVTLANGNER